MNSSRPCGPANPALIPELGARARNGRVLFRHDTATSAPPAHRRGFGERRGAARRGAARRGAHRAGLRTAVSAVGKEVKKTTFPSRSRSARIVVHQTALAPFFMESRFVQL
ncbi:hypothetical protein EYF80_003612 [Liparis tanakae]|uniref:Uncharacterized protein n=1 Tax=Liparis tanakae TaxID=230148 RepID=A0A4Z2J750_9TELE|nr:hypothetical protein EYF80_003612 [Liparis tanakae]